MVISVLGLLAWFVIIGMTNCHWQAKFLKTEVYLEMPACLQRNVNKAIEEGAATSDVDCGKRCIKSVKCQRFMYDKVSRVCSLYSNGENCYSDVDVDNKICYRQLSMCDDVNCTRCPVGYYGDRCQEVIQDCYDGYLRGVIAEDSALSYIRPSAQGVVVEARCERHVKRVGYTIILSRQECLEIDFNRTWSEYARGFGYKHGNYWLGLEHISNIVRNHPTNKLNFNIVYGSFNRKWRAIYHSFGMGDSSSNYNISITNNTNFGNGFAGDSIAKGNYSINGRPFSTYDRDYTSHDCGGITTSGSAYEHTLVSNEQVATRMMCITADLVCGPTTNRSVLIVWSTPSNIDSTMSNVFKSLKCFPQDNSSCLFSLLWIRGTSRRFGGGWWYLDDPVCSRANVMGSSNVSGIPFEATWFWLDNIGYRNDLERITMKVVRGL